MHQNCKLKFGNFIHICKKGIYSNGSKNYHWENYLIFEVVLFSGLCSVLPVYLILDYVNIKVKSKSIC